MDKREILQYLQTGAITPEEAKKLLLGKSQSKVKQKEVSNKDKIAIIGMSGRFPKAANMEEYWNVLKSGTFAVEEIPPSRFDVDRYYEPFPPKPGKTYCRWLGRLDDIEDFDPLFFNIAPIEAETMDPHHRIFLQEAYRAFEDAGYNPKALGDTKCGVYLGVMGNEYVTMLSNHNIKTPDITGDSMAIASARISYFLNLKGPAISIDTACSSSLVCTDMAFQALARHDVDMALVGGVTLYLTPDAFIKMSSTGMLAKDGKCKTFDNAADGFVPGEGAAALVLKRLEDAEADGDPIYGVLIGSGVNQDGKTNGITAPSVKRQKELIHEVYNKYGINPETISFAEMHGTGTKLGDPIELKAITRAFREKGNRENYCAIGSVKSNLGHTSAAAGVAGIEKVLLCMKHRTLVPTLHYQQPNEHFDYDHSPFYVNTKLKEWKDDYPRRACVSAFGFSGTNSHVVIEEYVKEEKQERSRERAVNQICVLSAKNRECLQEKARELCEYIRKNKDLLLEDILFTLQVGREEMEARASFVLKTKEELCDKLEQISLGKTEGEVFYHVCKTGFEGEPIEQEMYQSVWKKPDRENIERVLEKWENGAIVDWIKLCRNRHGKRIHLPVYPFRKDKYWLVSDEKDMKGQDKENCVAWLHPLVQKNCSSLSGVRFETELTGTERLLLDHKVAGKRLFPASAYIEMFWFGTLEVIDKEIKDEIMEQKKKVVLKKLLFQAPLWVENGTKRIYLCFRNRDSLLRAEIYEIDGDRKNTLCECIVDIEKAGEREKIDRDEEKQARAKQDLITGEECYKQFEIMDLQYGKTHQGIQKIYRFKNKAYIDLGKDNLNEEEYCFDIGLLDSAFQSAYGLYQELDNSRAYIPYMIESCELFKGCKERATGKIERIVSSRESRVVNVSLFDQTGELCLKINGFLMQLQKSPKVHVMKNVKEVIDEVRRGQMTRDEFETVFGE
ncbi:MAG TPA: hypothetical protein DCW90_24855 [Lachnospiraceae bacterium]|nr:beta-ketoacyl synthase N-terminal-like domain-containing protein [uncultured Lachnoclostridium sp.]HAU88584.1 hypothetical protein [Lachnospiraceae bacterium]